MTKSWTTCPGCGWSYEAHGDTHMSTRFNCARSRSSAAPHDRGIAGRISDYVPYDKPISEGAADTQTERVIRIMEQQQLNFGPATDVFIKEQAARPAQPALDTSGWDAA